MPLRNALDEECIAGSCSLDIPFAIGTLLVAGASIPVKNVISGKDDK